MPAKRKRESGFAFSGTADQHVAAFNAASAANSRALGFSPPRANPSTLQGHVDVFNAAGQHNVRVDRMAENNRNSGGHFHDYDREAVGHTAKRRRHTISVPQAPCELSADGEVLLNNPDAPWHLDLDRMEWHRPGSSSAAPSVPARPGPGPSSSASASSPAKTASQTKTGRPRGRPRLPDELKKSRKSTGRPRGRPRLNPPRPPTGTGRPRGRPRKHPIVEGVRAPNAKHRETQAVDAPSSGLGVASTSAQGFSTKPAWRIDSTAYASPEPTSTGNHGPSLVWKIGSVVRTPLEGLPRLATLLDIQDIRGPQPTPLQKTPEKVQPSARTGKGSTSSGAGVASESEDSSLTLVQPSRVPVHPQPPVQRGSASAEDSDALEADDMKQSVEVDQKDDVEVEEDVVDYIDLAAWEKDREEERLKRELNTAAVLPFGGASTSQDTGVPSEGAIVTAVKHAAMQLHASSIPPPVGKTSQTREPSPPAATPVETPLQSQHASSSRSPDSLNVKSPPVSSLNLSAPNAVAPPALGPPQPTAAATVSQLASSTSVTSQSAAAPSYLANPSFKPPPIFQVWQPQTNNSSPFPHTSIIPTPQSQLSRVHEPAASVWSQSEIQVTPHLPSAAPVASTTASVAAQASNPPIFSANEEIPEYQSIGDVVNVLAQYMIPEARGPTSGSNDTACS